VLEIQHTTRVEAPKLSNCMVARGKTILLQTMAYELLRKYTPEQINLYMVDCGSMVLKMFENSIHAGGVVLASEEEKCKNLFKLLNATVVERKKILSGKGVGNFASYLDAGYTDMPLLVVMIDNMAGFKEYFPDETDQINSLTREAQGVGISFVVTAATSNAMNYRTQANFGKKIALNCNDTADKNILLQKKTAISLDVLRKLSTDSKIHIEIPRIYIPDNTIVMQMG